MLRPEGAVPIALEVLDREPRGPQLVARPPRVGRSGRRSWPLIALVVVLGVAGLLVSPLVGVHALTASLRSFSLGLEVLVTSSWPWLLVLVAVAVVHYVLAALALRAAAGSGWGVRVPEAARVQLVAAAANRVTPSGLGAAAVNARHLSRCGQTPSRSVGSVGAMNLFGAVADGGLLLLLLGVGAVLGQRGSAPPGLAAGARHLVPDPSSVPPLGWIAVGAVLALLTGLAVCSRARAAGVVGRVRVVERVQLVLGQAVEQITSMRRRPKDLAVLLLASAGTTLAMGTGLVVSVAAVTGGSVTGSVSGSVTGTVLAVLVGYLVGAAVGTAVPMPSGIGSTEAALVAALVATGLPAGAALSAVLLFRAVTFWAPVPIGVLVAPGLRRRGAL